MPLSLWGEKADRRPRPASQETGRHRDCARASGEVNRGGGEKPVCEQSTQWSMGHSHALRFCFRYFEPDYRYGARYGGPCRGCACDCAGNGGDRNSGADPVADIPAGVTVIDRATIEAHGYNTLTDALADVPGLHVSQSGGPGGQASVFIRGTNSDHVLVLRDGMPINGRIGSNRGVQFRH